MDPAIVAKLNGAVLYQGLDILGSGAILTGLILAAIGSFVIERKFMEASAFALAGAVLTFFGFMHGPAVGIAVTPTLTVAYVMVAAFIYGLSRYPELVSIEMAPAKEALAHPAE